MSSFKESGPPSELIACLSVASTQLRSHDTECLISKIQTVLTDNRATPNAPCTASVHSVCWIMDSLDSWNAILYRGGFTLREEKPGSLTCETPAVHANTGHLIDFEGLLEAACWFYLLFRQHRCVHRLVIGSLYPLKSEWYWLSVLEMSLRASKELGSLEVVSIPDGQGKCCVLEVAAGLSTLQRLKCTTRLTSQSSLCQMLQPCGHRLTELVLIFSEADLTMGGLFNSLGSCSSLETLRLDGNEIRNVGPLFSFMVHNKTVSHFSLKLFSGDMNYIEKGIASVLRQNTTLKQLELSLYGASASLIAESLEKNTALEVISMEGFSVADTLPLAQMLEINRTLRKLILAGVRSDVGTALLVEAVRSNETLLEVDVRGNDVLARGLVEALKYNSTLNSVHLVQVSASRDQGRFREAALRPWAIGRLVADCDDGCCLDLARALRSEAPITSVKLFYNNGRCDSTSYGLAELFDALRFNGTVKSLSLRRSASGFLPRRLVRQLCPALASNETLESLSLCFNDRKDVAILKIVCEGLAQNSHIRTLRINVNETDPAALQHMMALLGKSQSLTSLFLRVAVEGDDEGSVSKLEEWKAECVLLSEAISKSDFLLEVHIHVADYFCTALDYTPDFTLTVLRNLCGIRRAVRFSLAPSRDRGAAATFQRYQHSPVLFSKLKEAKMMSDKEAASLVWSAANFIACRFFIVTGVVKRTLQCERAERTALQLADLNEACLYRIVSYLKVCDVRD